MLFRSYAKMHDSDIRFIGVPKTIDNDLVKTDHTPGFGSAAKYIATTVREIAIDASVYDNKKSVTIRRRLKRKTASEVQKGKKPLTDSE